jgi:type IV secretory pathway VirB10-like protein
VSGPHDPNQGDATWWHRPTGASASRPAMPPPPPTRQSPPRYQQPYRPAEPPQSSQTPSAEPASDKSSKGKLVLIAGVAAGVIVALLVVGLVLTLTTAGNTKKLNINSVQSGVEKALTDPINGYSADEIKDVKCNNGQDPTAKEGDSFTCDVSVRGEKRQVKVTFRDNDGTYVVGLPQSGEGEK